MELRDVDWERQPKDGLEYDGEQEDLAAYNAQMALCTRCGQWYQFDEMHIDDRLVVGGGCEGWRYR